MTRSKVIQWGNSLAIKLPKSVRDTSGLQLGDDLDIFITGDKELVIKKSDGAKHVYDNYKSAEIID